MLLGVTCAHRYDVVFVMAGIYFMIKSMGGDKPLWKVNRWMDRFEDWREERLKGAFCPILRHANAGSDI